jgi:hypothetical protein
LQVNNLFVIDSPPAFTSCRGELVDAGEEQTRPGSRSDNLPPRTPLPHDVEDCDA